MSALGLQADTSPCPGDAYFVLAKADTRLPELLPQLTRHSTLAPDVSMIGASHPASEMPI
jgi:hypothetical protein